MIPYHLLSKMRPYEVEVHGVEVKVSVVADNDRLINEKISEFKKLNKKNVVGVDVKTTFNNASLLLFCVEGHCLIIPRLSLARIKDAHKSELWQLLSDQNTCFVGSNFEHMKHCSYSGKEIFEKVGGIGVELDRLAAMILKKPSLKKKGVYELAGEIHVKPVTGTCPKYWDAKVFSERKRSMNTVVELGRLAAMVLKKPSLQKKGLHELSGEIGMNIKPVSGTCSDLGADIFSEEEIKYLVYDVYASYLVGDKLLKML
ncbi:hypothetical protein ACLB2K_065029 [Fragaria x ananassa]